MMSRKNGLLRTWEHGMGWFGVKAWGGGAALKEQSEGEKPLARRKKLWRG
jgi:hypothetical protein